MKGSFLTNYSTSDEIVNVSARWHSLAPLAIRLSHTAPPPPHTRPLRQVMRCMFAVAQTLTYPLELFVARHSVQALFFADQKHLTDKQHYVVTLVLWGSSLAIALNVSDLGVVLELTGGVSAVFIGFVLPPFLHYKMGGFTPLIWRNPVGKRMAACKELAPSIFVMCFGIMAMVLTVYTIGMEMALGEGAPHDAFSGQNATVASH